MGFILLTYSPESEGSVKQNTLKYGNKSIFDVYLKIHNLKEDGINYTIFHHTNEIDEETFTNKIRDGTFLNLFLDGNKLHSLWCDNYNGIYLNNNKIFTHRNTSVLQRVWSLISHLSQY